MNESTIMNLQQVQRHENVLNGVEASYLVPGSIKVTNTRQGTSRRDWRWCIQNNVDATTPFSGVKRTIKYRPGDAMLLGWNPFISKDTIDRYSGAWLYDYASEVNYDVNLYNDADNEARTNFYKDVREAQMKMSGLTFMGELREAIHMVRHPAEAMRRGLSDYFSVLSKRKARNPGRRQRQRVLQDTWLEYSFGLKPLVMDVQAGYQAYKAVLDKVEWIPITSKGRIEKFLGESAAQLVAAGRVYFRYSTSRSQTTTVRYKSKVKGTALGPRDTLERGMDMFGFRLDEFIPTAYELLPWSFFLDYFSNIGDVIAANATINAEYAWVCQTVRHSGKSRTGQVGGPDIPTTKGNFPFGSSNFRSCSGILGSIEWTKTMIQRTSLTNVGLPNLAFRFPGSPNQIANLAALFIRSKSLTPFF